MKKYTVIVDEDYQAFNENCNITLDEIDLKISCYFIKPKKTAKSQQSSTVLRSTSVFLYNFQILYGLAISIILFSQFQLN